MRRKILRSGGVGFRLAFLEVVVRIVVDLGGVRVGDFAFGSRLFSDAGSLVVREGVVLRMLVCVVVQLLVGLVRGFLAVSFVGVFAFVPMRRGAAERFAGKQLDSAGGHGRERRRSGGRLIGVRVTVIVVFEIFEDIADVKEGVAIEADVNERGLHAGEDAGNSAFVDAADEGELFFALDVNFD